MRALSFKYCPLRGDIRGESPDEGHSGGQKARAQVWARRWGQGGRFKSMSLIQPKA